MILADLFISARDWFWPAAILFAVALGLLLWNYRGARVATKIGILCWSLKALGITALLICLLEPLWSGTRARPGANFFALLADNSMGLQIRDLGATATRAEEMHQLLTATRSSWQDSLQTSFALRRYFFDSKLEATRDFAEMRFDGRASSLDSALKQIGERFRGQPLAGVLLFTDGNATDLTDAQFDGGGLPPIYPVVIGNDEPVRDVAIEKISVSQTPFEDAPVTVLVDTSANGYGRSNVTVKFIELPRPGQTVTAKTNEQSQAVNTLSASQFRFQLKPLQAGVTFYQAVAAIPGAVDEATLLNNSRTVVVDRGQGPFRILYVSGRPNWEFKFLNRALQEDDQLQLVGLIRIAKREPKFDFRGRRNETSNPLFRGFDKTDEATEKYDQPVLVRLNTADENELKAGFPKTEEDLFQYHGIIIDDVETEFFSREQLTLLQKFVSERGGGFLMLGGQESFSRGKHERTAVGDMLPIYIERISPPKLNARWKLSLTREGWLQPWIRLRSTELEEQQRLSEMPAFEVLNTVGSLRPGASVIASVTDGTDVVPALAVQRFGHGKTGALMVGDLWRWGLSTESAQKDLARAWRQMARWLVSDVPGQFALEVLPGTGESVGGVILQVTARDGKFQPLDNAAIQLEINSVRPPSTSSTNVAARIQLTADPILQSPGVYQASFVPRESGGYLVEAIVLDANGKQLAKLTGGWSSDPTAAEFESLKPNRALLESIARKTGGEVVELRRLDAFAKALPMKKAPITEAWTYPLWHQPSVFLFALLCFVGEWGLRRWKGLA